MCVRVCFVVAVGKWKYSITHLSKYFRIHPKHTRTWTHMYIHTHPWGFDRAGPLLTPLIKETADPFNRSSMLTPSHRGTEIKVDSHLLSTELSYVLFFFCTTELLTISNCLLCWLLNYIFFTDATNFIVPREPTVVLIMASLLLSPKLPLFSISCVLACHDTNPAGIIGMFFWPRPSPVGCVLCWVFWKAS